jgi:hypothetical protein
MLGVNMRKKKIFIPVGGRLGNQLFYYGFGRWLQIKYFPEYELVFDFSNVTKQASKYKYEKSGWENSLREFQTAEYKEYQKDYSIFREGSLLQIIRAIIIKLKYGNLVFEHSLIRKLSSVGIVINNQKGLENVYDFQMKGLNKCVFVRSVLESSYYINQIRDQLLFELSSVNPRNPENDELYKIIESSESVCISIRRGDYVSNPDLQDRFNICNKDYFQTAIEIMKEKLEHPVFVFFSDDIEWCKKEFGTIDFGSIYFESGNDSLSEKLNLMKACKHFIISNSTFSWWAQWLSIEKDKIVVSPSIWFKDLDSYLIEDSFIKIRV